VRLKRLLGRAWGFLPTPPNRRMILIYHAVGDGPLAMPEVLFWRQMDWLKEHATVESLDSLLENRQGGGLRVALTFDDGYRCLHRHVAPILEERGFPATVYLNTAHIGDAEPCRSDETRGHYPGEEFLLWKEVGELQEKGWTIGSHGVEHIDLTTLPPDEVEFQAAHSKREIEQRLGETCRHYSYTWGRCNPAVQEKLDGAGYLYAVAGHHAPVGSDSNCLALPRIDIRREYTLNDFIAVVSGRWDYLGLVQRMRK
jgi:peptidoglycan/xylan/chitin deacetylase (PgdA/CDA1 family)